MSSTRLTQLLAFHEQNPKDSFILFALAKEHEKLGDDESARLLYEQLYENDSGYVGLYYHKGKLQEKSGEFRAAFFTYKEGMAAAKKAGDQHAFNELAAAKTNLGDDDDFE